MKSIKYIIAAALACLMIGSCSLDEVSYTEVEQQNYMNNADQAESVLLGVYRNMMKDGLYGYHLSIYFAIPTDQAKVEGNSTNNFRNVPCNNYGATEDEVEKTWAQLYNAIYNANDFLAKLKEKMPEYTDNDKKRAEVYEAEAKCLRALYYFELVRWFGNIALITTPEESYKHPSTFEQAAPELVYAQIEKDLTEAIKVLPYASDDAVRKTNAFRFSKGGALGLLTKVYATWAGAPVADASKWEKAVNTAEELVSSKKHGLLDDYEQLWKNSANNKWDPTESLIEVSFYTPTMTGMEKNDPSGRIGKWNGVAAAEGSIKVVRVAANVQVLPTFLANWPDRETDKRWAISFADHQYTKDGKVNLSKKGTFLEALEPGASSDLKREFNSKLTPGKWDIEKYSEPGNMLVDANMSNVNWYILRYADVLLLDAEAWNEYMHGPTQQAYDAINLVRKRAGLDPLPSGLSYEEFQKAVRDERSYELAFEGHRRQDLTRWIDKDKTYNNKPVGIYYQTIKDTWFGLAAWDDEAPDKYKAGDYTTLKNSLLPIPQRDMDLMPKFIQNPDW